MARIRTIKPEFPQSEKMGKLSRDARLLFVQLWTLVDDEGRARGASRMLASLLYPYDDDARVQIDGWLDELERHNCVRRYTVEGSQYLDIPNWLKHQKIDKPSKSRLPEFPEPSRTVAKPREDSATDLGPRTVDQDQDTLRSSAGVTTESLLAHWPAWKRIEEVLEIDPADTSWFAQHGRVAQWLANDWDLELDILPTLLRKVANQRKKSGRPIRRLEFFEEAIADARATRMKPVPVGFASEKPYEKPARGSITAALDEHIERFRRQADADRGTGEAPPRLLSNR